MNFFKLKCMIAQVCEVLQLNSMMLSKINKEYSKNYIRVINYHGTEIENGATFEKQLKWYKQNFDNVNYEIFEKYMQGQYNFVERPGIILTFDDGIDNNYDVAKSLLEKYGFTGYFMVSSDLIETEGYMTWEHVKELIADGHVIGCHTASHHRMNEDDTEEVLLREIVESKKKLETLLNKEIAIFCWCGGEEEHYTKIAADMIRNAKYKYSFMTNSLPVTSATNFYQIERSNVEASWSISLLKFQICGWMDLKFKKKRERVETLTQG